MAETKRVVRRLTWIVFLCIVTGCLVGGVSADTVIGHAEVQTLATVSPQYITCTAPCECWSEERAYALWGANGYVKCDDRPCGGFPGEFGKIYEYCYKKKPVTAVPVVNITTPVPIVITTTPVPAPVRIPAQDAPARYEVTEESGQQAVVMPAHEVVSSVSAVTGPPAMVRKGASSQEALIALQIAVGKLPYAASYDMNKDGIVNSADAREILRLSVQGPQGG